MPSNRGSSQPRDRARVSHVSCIGGVFFFFFFLTASATWEAQIIVYLYVNWNNPRKGRNAWCKSQVRSFKMQNY